MRRRLSRSTVDAVTAQKTMRRRPLLRTVDAPTWRAAAVAHRERVLRLCNGALADDPSEPNQQRAAGLRRANHPIYNFLFVYYSFDPALLLDAKGALRPADA